MPLHEELESQFVDLDHENAALSPTLIRNLGLDTRVSRENAYQQISNDTIPEEPHPKPERHASVVEETQFEGLELDTQATLDDIISPLTPSDRSVEHENTSHGPLTGSSTLAPLFTRPIILDNVDPSEGFKMIAASKPKAGQFNRQPSKRASDTSINPGLSTSDKPVAVEAPQPITVPQSQFQCQPNPATPKDMETQHPDVTTRGKATSDAARSNFIPDHVIKESNRPERESIPESPIQEGVPEPTLWQATQTPVTAPAQSKSTLGTSNKGHKRMKQPFPEVTSNTRNRRSQSGLSKIKQTPTENPRYRANNKEESRFQEATNTRHIRASSRATDPTENLTRRRQRLSSIAHDFSTHQNYQEQTIHRELSFVQQNNEIVNSNVQRDGMTISDSDGEKQPGANTTSTRVAAQDLGIQLGSDCLPNTQHPTSNKGLHPDAHEVHPRTQAQLLNIQHMSDLSDLRSPQYAAVANGGQNDAGDRIDGAQVQGLDPLSTSTTSNDTRCGLQEQNAEVAPFIQSIVEQAHLPGGSSSMHPQNHVVGADTHASSNSRQGDHPECQPASQVPSRVPSRTQSEAHSRPQSRRSNHGKSMTRPFSSHDLHPPAASEFAALHSNHATKVKKSGRAQNQVFPIAQSSSPVSTDKRQPAEHSGLSRRFHDLLNTLSEYDNMIRNFEQQKQQIEFQRNEIIKLKDSDTSSQKRIETLEKEKESLTQKVKKLEELSSKYRKHMNEVVQTQKFLKTEATKIMEASAQAVEVYAGRAEGEAVTQRLRCAIEDSKGLRVAVEKSASVLQKNQELEALNKALLAEKQKLEIDCKQLEANWKKFATDCTRFETENENLGDSCKKLKAENDRVITQNEQLLSNLEDAMKNQELIQSDLDLRLEDLGREKFNVKQLQEQLQGHINLHKQLVEMMQKLPEDVAGKLIGEDSILGKILSSENATKTKIDEATILINDLKNQELKAPASLIKLIEDLFSKFENGIYSLEGKGMAFRESSTKLLEHLKESLSQLCLDKETELGLNTHIAELGQVNASLTTQNNSREREIQGLTNQLDELKRDLFDCRTQLGAKNDELIMALASPKEETRLQAKIQDLENSNSTLVTQLEGANQETTRVKEQLNELHEMSQRKEQQARELEQKFNDAQMNIKNFNAEKNKYITVQDSEKKCQDIVKAADAQKATMKIKLESEVKNLEQRNKEVEAELAFANQEVRRYRDGNDAYSDKATQLQAELKLYKERFAQQFSQLQQLDTRITGGETSRTNHPRTQGEIAELRNYFLSVRSETAQSIDAVARTLRNMEERFRNLDSLEKEKDKLEEQNVSLQMRVETLADRMRHNPQDKGDVDVFSPSKGRPVMATPQQTFATGSDARKLRSSVRPSSVNSNYSISTPEETLRSNSNRMGPKNLAFQLKKGLHATPSLILETPAVQNTAETPTNNHHLDTSYFNFAPSVLQHQGTNQRTLRAASRKRSNLPQARAAKGVKSLPSRLTAPPSTAAPSYGLRYSTVDVPADTQTPSYIRPFSEMTPLDDVSSDLTDMDPVIELLDLANTQQQLHDRIEQGRISKYKRADTSAHVSDTALQTVTTHAVALPGKIAPVHQADDDGNPPAKVIKFTKSAPSNSEESYRRRNSQPGKSALKKTGVSTRTTEDATRKTATFDAAQGAPVLQDRTSARANRKQSHTQNISIGSFKGAVSGRGVTSMAEKSSIVSQSGMDSSPPMKEPSRNKRYDSSTLESSKRKMPRTSLAREQSRREIPDSQEDYFPE